MFIQSAETYDLQVCASYSSNRATNLIYLIRVPKPKCWSLFEMNPNLIFHKSIDFAEYEPYLMPAYGFSTWPLLNKTCGTYIVHINEKKHMNFC